MACTLVRHVLRLILPLHMFRTVYESLSWTKLQQQLLMLFLQGVWGSRVLQINTQDAVPTVVPKTLLRNFSPEYMEFCIQVRFIVWTELSESELMH